MGAYLYGLRRYGDGAAASTLAFNTLTLNELAHSFSSRSSYRNVLTTKRTLPPNPHLTRAILGMGALQAVVSVVPAFRRLLGTTPLGVADLGVIAAGVLLPLVVNEATKPTAPVAIIEDDEGWIDGETIGNDDELEETT
jgi:Ca2+-transporting ATPase